MAAIAAWRPFLRYPWLFLAGWWLFLAGAPFENAAVPGLLLLLAHWLLERPRARLDAPTLAVAALTGSLFLSAALSPHPRPSLLAALAAVLPVAFGLLYVRPLQARLGAASPLWWVGLLGPFCYSALFHAAWALASALRSSGRAITALYPNGVGTAMLLGLGLGWTWWAARSARPSPPSQLAQPASGPGGPALAQELAAQADTRSALAPPGLRPGAWWLAVPYSALVAAGALASGSRGAWIGIAALAGAAALGLLATPSGRRLLLPAAGLVTVLAALALATHPRLPARTLAILTDPGRNEGRLHIYTAAWAMFADHPWLGVGPGLFTRYWAQYGEAWQAVEPRVAHAHNLLLQLLAETGLLGTASYLLLLLAVGVGAWRHLRLYLFHPAWVGLAATWIAWLVRDQVDLSLAKVTNAFLFWSLSGILLGSTAHEPTAHEPTAYEAADTVARQTHPAPTPGETTPTSSAQLRPHTLRTAR